MTAGLVRRAKGLVEEEEKPGSTVHSRRGASRHRGSLGSQRKKYKGIRV